MHLMSARSSLATSALGPSTSGYMFRQICESIKNVKVDYLGRAVGERGEVIQVLYGDDGLDWARMRFVAVHFPPLPPGGTALGNARWLDRPRYELPLDLDKEIELLGIWPHAHHDTAMAARVDAAVAWAVNGASARIQAVVHRRLPGCLHEDTPLFRGLLQRIRTAMDIGRIEPGEAVGMIAAESIGADLTQGQLDMFHVGTKGGQSAQTTPRMQELVFAKQDIERPCVSLRCASEADALALCRKLAQHRPLRTVVEATAEHFARPWANRWRRAGMPVPEGDMAVFATLDREAFLGWPGALKGRMMHSHERCDAALEVIAWCGAEELRQAFCGEEELAEGER